MRAQGILETCLYVDSLAAAESFYHEILGLQVHDRQSERHVFFYCGGRMLLIFDARASRQSDGRIPPHGSVGAGHVCFAARQDELPLWETHLATHGIAIEAIVEWPRGGRSIYFRDPSGNSLEIATPRIWGLPEEI